MNELIQAIQNNNIKLIKQLLKNSEIDLNFHFNENNNNSFLHIACSHNANLKILKILIEKGADVNLRNSETPLYIACLFGLKLNCLKFLIKSGADIHAQNKDTPLHGACERGDLDAIKFLIEEGAKVNIKNFSLLFNFAKIYLSSGLDEIPLHYSCTSLLKLEIIQILLETGSDILSQTQETPLHYACVNRASHEIVQLMLNFGASVSIENLYTPLHYACLSECEYQVIDLLIKAGANVNARNEITPLHYAIKKEMSFEAIELLLNAGADINILNGEELEPLRDNVKELFQYHSSFEEDFTNLFSRQEFTDEIIQCKNGEFGVHKMIINYRIGEKKYPQIYQVLKNWDKKKAMKFFEFLYGNCVKAFTQENEIQNLLKELSFTEFKNKRGKKGLIDDFERMIQDENSKDFQIIVEQKPIRVHKIVLIARSDLFRGMFLNVQDDSNQVKDYSGKSYETIRTLVNFFYNDQLPDSVSNQVVTELLDCKDFYQLNQNTILNYKLKNIMKKRKMTKNLAEIENYEKI
ncbi:ankyrin repeat-containing protein [Anaeramoeba ignava]|uniref:Ankyrin repeat-containing protein n=1 Tax=Anaeramoeba ignava TaxID=1746090 RepID=A0A9Q0R6W0_ANAIG|nr:ankyrin repeat-containing protein [Anaeramoeba ignava]